MKWCLSRLVVAIVVLTASSWNAGLAGNDSVTLIQDGSSRSVIFISAHPEPEEQTAALWLAETLEQVGGARIPVRMENTPDVSADTPFIRLFFDPSLKSEEWKIEATGNALLLSGGRPRGLIYAVCEFLETQTGVYRLDPFTEVVPKQSTVSVSRMNRQGRPAFEHRYVFTGWPYQHSASQGTNGGRWRTWNKDHLYAGPATGDYPRVVPGGVHTFGNFLSAKEFAAEHPEYFSMDADGKRMTDDMGNPALWIQLCVTSEDVRRITIERATKMLRDDAREAAEAGRTPAKLLVLSQNDNTTSLCLCPNCRAISQREGSESGALLDFVNHVASHLKTEFPDVTVQTEAYNFTLQPPRTIRPEDNVMVRYCDNYGLSDMTRPLEDPRNSERLGLLEDWASSAKELGIWDYWRTFESHPPGLLAPSTNVRAMERDIRLFQKLGVTYVTIESEDFLGAGLNDSWTSNDLQSFMPLRAWLGMKLLDDPARDANVMLDIFCRGYYGNAAVPMRELLELIEERQTQMPIKSCDMRRHVWLTEMCDAAFFADAFRCLDEAIRAVADDPASMVHVQRERIIIDSAYLWRESAVRRESLTTEFPDRAIVLKRHRSDWTAYVRSVFNEEGQKLVEPLPEPGLALLEKLTAADTDADRAAICVDAAQLTVDGLLNEAFWLDAQALRLLPRDPAAVNDDKSKFRFAWTSEALVVGVEQPKADAAAIYEISLMTPDRQGVQLALHARPDGTVSPYFYAYPATGMIAVSGRTTGSKIVSVQTDSEVSAEIRIPWADISVMPESGKEILLNIATFPRPDSPTPDRVSSPWLIGVSPTYNPIYYATITLQPPRAGAAGQ